SRRRHTRSYGDWSSDVCSSDLQALSSALLGSQMPASRQALALIQEEEAGGGGAATVLWHGAKLTKAGAAFANAETIFAGGKWDRSEERRVGKEGISVGGRDK